MSTEKNSLYFADCLDVLKRLNSEQAEGFIDLIYIDPPFNSKRNYNILYEDADMKDVKAQKEAFADTWSNVSYKDTLQQIKSLDLDLFRYLECLDGIRISKSAVSYLTTMAIRIWYMHEVLKKTGSFYLHCDPKMSHYLKVVCDLIFGEANFRNEIAWCYKERELSKKHFNKKHDIILFYTKSDDYTFNTDEILEEYSPGTIKKFNYRDDDGRKFQIRGKGGEYTGKQGLNISLETTHPELVYRDYLDKSKGILPRDWWEIPFINRAAKERLGYPTQKPEALLKRILMASSNKNDLAADFFCGCGTTIAVAQSLKRRWLGVDISHLAIGLIERRLLGNYDKKIKNTYQVDGFPRDVSSAKQLAAGTEGGRLKFQDWIIEAMLGGVHNPKKTADGGWDGHLTFDIGNKKEIVLIEVKSGNVNVKNLREFIHVTRKEKAAIGLFVCFKEQITKPMLLEAKEQGYYCFAEHQSSNYDKIQLITIEDLLEGTMPRIPYSINQTFKTAQKKASNGNGQNSFEL